MKIPLDNPCIKQENVKTDRKRDLLSVERQRTEMEAHLRLSRSEIRELDKTVQEKEREVKMLEHMTERENYRFKELLECIEKKSADAKTLFENESKTKEEMTASIEKLTGEIGNIKIYLAKDEDILNRFMRCKKILFKLSSPEWQEAEALKAHNDTLSTKSKRDCSISEYELLDRVAELTEQNLSLLQNSTRVDETLEELRRTTETTLKKMTEDEEKLTLQVNDMKDRVGKEKERAAELKKKVKLHDSLKTEDQDVLLDVLGMKVTEVYRCCVDSNLANLSTLEKLSSVEYRVSSLLEVIESIPEENLETLRKIKDSERRSRLREEELRLERKKQKERMKKCMQRSLGDTKKISGRKLMVRCIPVKQETKVSDNIPDNIPAEDELVDQLMNELHGAKTNDKLLMDQNKQFSRLKLESTEKSQNTHFLPTSKPQPLSVDKSKDQREPRHVSRHTRFPPISSKPQPPSADKSNAQREPWHVSRHASFPLIPSKSQHQSDDKWKITPLPPMFNVNVKCTGRQIRPHPPP